MTSRHTASYLTISNETPSFTTASPNGTTTIEKTVSKTISSKTTISTERESSQTTPRDKTKHEKPGQKNSGKDSQRSSNRKQTEKKLNQLTYDEKRFKRESMTKQTNKYGKFEIFHVCIGMIAIVFAMTATIIYFSFSNYDFLALGTGVWAGTIFIILGGVVVGLTNKDSFPWKILLYFCIILGLVASLALLGTETYAALKSYWIISNKNDWVFTHRNYPVVRTTTFLIVFHCLEAMTGLVEAIVCITHFVFTCRSHRKGSTTSTDYGLSKEKIDDDSASRKSAKLKTRARKKP